MKTTVLEDDLRLAGDLAVLLAKVTNPLVCGRGHASLGLGPIRSNLRNGSVSRLQLPQSFRLAPLTRGPRCERVAPKATPQRFHPTIAMVVLSAMSLSWFHRYAATSADARLLSAEKIPAFANARSGVKATELYFPTAKRNRYEERPSR